MTRRFVLPVLGRLRGLTPLAVALSVWQISAPHDSVFFPPPSTWAPSLGALWEQGTLWPAATATLRTMFTALVFATILGTGAGILIGASRLADRALGPTLEFARVMPPAAVVPVATLLIGYKEQMKLTVVTLAAIWAVLLNTRSGVHRLDPILIDTARSFRLGRLAMVRKVALPALLPAIFTGVRVAAPVALIITLLVEIVTHVPGIGELISTSQRNYQSARVYGLILVAGALSLLLSGLVGALESFLFRHRPPDLQR